MSFGKCFTKFKTKLDVRSLFDAHFSTDTTKVLSLLARYFSFSTSKYHKNLTQHFQSDGATSKRAIWNVLKLLNFAGIETERPTATQYFWWMCSWKGDRRSTFLSKNCVQRRSLFLGQWVNKPNKWRSARRIAKDTNAFRKSHALQRCCES